MIESKSTVLFALFLLCSCLIIQQCEANWNGRGYGYSGYGYGGYGARGYGYGGYNRGYGHYGDAKKKTEDLQVKDEKILKNGDISKNIFDDDMDADEAVNEFLSYLEVE